jgi:hypothetical protein
MERRDFLLLTGAAALAPVTTAPAATAPAATALYGERSVALDRIQPDPKRSSDALWVRKADLPRINDFELKPQGACRADVCIPISKDMTHGEYFNLTAFARKVGESVVADSETKVWSFGEIPALRGGFLGSRIAPDFAVPDRKGRVIHLSDFRGKKVLVVTWASW